MKLVLAEKPSVAQSIAKVLGANKRSDGYLEGNGYLVSWCVGHLVELMDRGFMEHYFEIAYNDVAGEIAGDDERYSELQKAADEAIQALAGIVGESNTALCKQCEHAINSLYAVQLHLAKLAYLRGAEDREKMLR